MFEGLIVAAAIGARCCSASAGSRPSATPTAARGLRPADRRRAGAGRASRPGIVVVRLYPIPLRGRGVGRRPRPRPRPDARRASGAGKAARRPPCCSSCSRRRPSGAFAADRARQPRPRRGGRGVAGGRRGLPAPAAERRAARRASTRRRCRASRRPRASFQAASRSVDAPGPRRIVVDARGGEARGGARRDARRHPASRPGSPTPAPGPIPAIVSRSARRQPARRAGRARRSHERRGLRPDVQGGGGPRLVPGRARSIGHFVVVAREAFLGQAPPGPGRPGLRAASARPRRPRPSIRAAVAGRGHRRSWSPSQAETRPRSGPSR